MAKKTAKLYPCFGHKITIPEAAEFACVGPEGFRAQLKKLGGDMEAAIEYYEKRYGGVKARMENVMEQNAKELATQKIAEILGVQDEKTEAGESETAPPAMPEEEKKPVQEEKPLRKAKPRIELAPAKDNTPEDRKALALYNAAIDALTKLVKNETFERDTLNYTPTCIVLDGLKRQRREYFEKLIDWYAIAAIEERGRQYAGQD